MKGVKRLVQAVFLARHFAVLYWIYKTVLQLHDKRNAPIHNYHPPYRNKKM